MRAVPVIPARIPVAEEEVLDRDPGRLSRRHGDFDAFFGLDRLMDAVAPFAAFGQSSGELVDDHDFPVANDVLPVQMVIAVDLDRPLDVLIQVDQADTAEQLRLGNRPQELTAGRSQFGLLGVVIVVVVFVLDELGACSAAH